VIITLKIALDNNSTYQVLLASVWNNSKCVRKKRGSSTAPFQYLFVRSYRQSATRKGLNSGLGTAQDQGMHIVCALIGVDRFQVDHVTNDVEFI
jgi:hypothetical protein